MRVLILHSRYLSGSASGENQVVADEARLLRDAGHRVWIYEPRTSTSGSVDLLQAGTSALWSVSASRAVARTVRERRIDVVHVHNLFPNLSPAVLRAASAAGASVVVTLHNYRLMCLPADLLRKDRICELCVNRLPWRGVALRCYRDSTLASGAIAASLMLHRAIGSFDTVNRYLAVSDFVKTKYVQGGTPPELITVKPNFTWPVTRRSGPGEFFLFVGRLAPEKGLQILLEAWKASPTSRLVVAGDGPQAIELQRKAPPSVEFLGSVPHEEVPKLLAGARALVVPSQWYEAAPKGIIEAFAAGVPVLAAKIGALQEIVDDGVTGIQVPSADPSAWAAAAMRLLDDEESERLGAGAWRAWQELYSPEIGLQALESSYREALASR